MANIKVIENEHLPLDIPSFTCDENAVGDHLNAHPLLKLLNVFGFLVVVGRPGQGKTSLTTALICQKEPRVYRKTHHHVYVIMPSQSRASMRKDPFKRLPSEQLYDDLNEATLDDLYRALQTNSSDKRSSLVYIDDMTASLKASTHVQQRLKQIVFNRRHLKTNIILTTQSFSALPLDIRKNVQSCIMFKPSKAEFTRLFDELLETKKEQAMEIMRFVYGSDPHAWFFLNVPSQRMFREWDEIILSHDSSDQHSDMENNERESSSDT